MNPRVKDVVANKDFTITVTFTNGEIGIFDVKHIKGVANK